MVLFSNGNNSCQLRKESSTTRYTRPVSQIWPKSVFYGAEHISVKWRNTHPETDLLTLVKAIYGEFACFLSLCEVFYGSWADPRSRWAGTPCKNKSRRNKACLSLSSNIQICIHETSLQARVRASRVITQRRYIYYEHNGNRFTCMLRGVVGLRVP